MKLLRLLCAFALAAALPLAADAAVSVFVNISPPLLPVYVQPPIPSPGYLWTPGYWRWDPISADYFWVPGTWVAPPAVGLLWTPGWWGWVDRGYLWHGGYWGPRVGFYGGINYGCGYIGSGYHGGYWRGGVFNYNRSVNNINTTIVRNVYNTTVVENHTRVSFNGGQGGIAARPGAEERAAHGERHIAPTPMQRQHEQVALRTPEQRASFNHGAPALAAMPRPGESRGAETMRGRPMQERPAGNVPPPPRRELARGEAVPAMAQHDRRGDRPEASGQRAAAPVAQQAHPQPQLQPHSQAPVQAQPHPQQRVEGQRGEQPQARPAQPGRAEAGGEHRGGNKNERER